MSSFARSFVGQEAEAVTADTQEKDTNKEGMLRTAYLAYYVCFPLYTPTFENTCL